MLAVKTSIRNKPESRLMILCIQIFPAQPVSIWIIGAFVVGGAIGLLLGLGFFKNLKARSEIKKLNKQLADAKQEVAQLRAMTLKDL